MTYLGESIINIEIKSKFKSSKDLSGIQYNSDEQKFKFKIVCFT